MTAEHDRLREARDRTIRWKRWGPYLSERQWGTVREDYSRDGDAWNHFTHDQARSRAYRWGEDGIAGISDSKQRLCFALALWNGRDPILKERLFGLTNEEGNHGEDVKECYFYLDSTPTHSYMKYLYKYPQAPYPYLDLVETSRRRGRAELEYELLDTGIFDESRYFDVFIEYAKANAEDILIEITAHNRGPEAAELHLLPTLWFRNRWSWGGTAVRPSLRQIAAGPGFAGVGAMDEKLGERRFYCEGEPPLLFTENETNNERLYGTPNPTPYVKDGINDHVVLGKQGVVNPEKIGTKVAAHYRLAIESGGRRILRLRLAPGDKVVGEGSAGIGPSTEAAAHDPFGANFTAVMEARRDEADAFYASITPDSFSVDQARVMRQALAGMLWGKQYYFYDVDKWLEERGEDPFKPRRKSVARNGEWHHMYNAHILSMPDKWEYPWYAAWDLAFHVLALNLVDEEFAKKQLSLMLIEHYLHPNGQIPAYEWNFGAVNPPVQAWSAIFTYRMSMARWGKGDLDWLEQIFQKLALNFTWWVNRKDREGRNVFEGGFLGMDNIGVFDRSAPLPTGGYLEQADGTAWMGLFCLNMLEIVSELAMAKPSYADMGLKFTEHFLWIASAMIQPGEEQGMWDETDGFFYDVLRLPDGSSQPLKIRSLVGLLPFCAAGVFEGHIFKQYPKMAQRLDWFLDARPELVAAIHDPRKLGCGGRRLGAILNEAKLRRVLAKMLDEAEFLSPYGIRSLSRFHADNPYVFWAGNREFRVGYLPAESDSGMFGGNSNWRGPIWMPVNVLIIRALIQYYAYYGNDFLIECPTGSGRLMNLYEVAEEIVGRLAKIFLRDEEGRRPVHGGAAPFQSDPHWRDHLLFYEYFHGDNGAGIGASHQTGWTGVIAELMRAFAQTSAEQILKRGQRGYFEAVMQGLGGPFADLAKMAG
jgi:Glycosyl hydrolase family 63 C-terminal domain